MTRPIKLIINCETGEETTEEFNDEEMAQWEIDQAAALERKNTEDAEFAAKEAARQSGIAKLVALGLTEQEAQALVK